MTTFSNTKRIIITFALIVILIPLKSQIKPEVTLGLRYNSNILFRTSHDNHPFAIEAGGGINYNKNWYSGVNANYFKTKSNETGGGFNHYLIELELRRSFEFISPPKLSLFFSFRPGSIFVSGHSTTSALHYSIQTMTISLSTGVSYSISDKIKFSIWPGITWLPQESSKMFNKPEVGSFCGSSFIYKF